MAGVITQHAVEVLVAANSRAAITQYAIEVLLAHPGATSPTTPDGVGVTQHVVEILVALDSKVVVSQHAIEVLFCASDVAQTGTTAATRGWVSIR